MKRTVFITGGAGGIGLEIARQMLAGGDRVIVGARAERLDALRADLAGVEGIAVDLSSFGSIRQAAALLREMAPQLDILINNAGVVDTKRREAENGHEMTWMVNVLAPYALTELLIPQLEAGTAPRVVMVGSVAHKSGRLVLDDPEFKNRKYGGWAAYAQSKLALLLLVREFAKRYPTIAFDCVHPGAIATGIWRTVPGIFRAIIKRVMPPAAAGAVPVVAAANSVTPPDRSARYFNQLVVESPSAAALDDATAVALFDQLATVTAAGSANANA